MENTRNYRLHFVNYKKSGDHVQYIVRLSCSEDTTINSEFLERYSSLKDLHDVLKKEANSINFPKFPPKKFFGNTDEKFLNQRQLGLQHYFNTIMGSRDFSHLPSLKAWIDSIIKKLTKDGKADQSHRRTIDSNMDRNERVQSPIQKLNRTDSNSERKVSTQPSFVKNSGMLYNKY